MSLTGLTNLQPLHIKTVGIGTFDNTVSIGGTLTYEDVTNVDAIGIVTARSGIRVGANGLKRETVHLDAGDSGANYLRFTNTTTGNGTADGFNVGINADENALLWNFESKDTIFATNNLERLRITSDGTLGINETSPNSVLHVKHTNNNTADITIEGGGTGNAGLQFIPGGQTNSYFAYVDTNRNLRIQDHTAERLRIIAGGKVLIGNGTFYTPQGMLHIVGDDNSNGPELYLMVPNNNVTDNIGALVFGNNVDKSVVKIQGVTHTANNTGDLTFHTSTTGTMSEKIRVTSDGILIINQTSASGTKLAIQSTASSGSGTATGIRVGNNIGALSQYPANIEVRTTGVATYNAIRTDAGDGNGGFTCGVESYNGFLDLTTGGSNTVNVKLRASGASYLLGGDFGIGTNSPSGKLHIDGIGSGDIIAELTNNSPTFTYRNGGGSWMHAGKHPTANEFIISEGATTTAVEMLRIQGGGGTNDSKFKFPSVESPSAHGESTAHIEIGGRHIWKRITSTNHVTTSTSTNHFYLAFWRSESGTKRTCYYRGVVVNVVASGNYDWSGHGYVTHSSQTILSFGGTTTGVHNTVYNQGFNQIHNTGGGTNMQLHNVAYSYDGTYLYANFRFKTNLSGTGFKPHYNVEVIAPDQILYTCEAF